VAPRILIIDDEAPVRELLSLYLRKKGFDVATAFASKGAMEMLDNSQFHLAILDANLNAECGLDLLRQLKSRHAQLPVIIFSGSLDEDLPRKAFAAGANGFMHKTNSLQELLTEVCRHIAR
jgi:DNA-binding response OmpR family regulator